MRTSRDSSRLFASSSILAACASSSRIDSSSMRSAPGSAIASASLRLKKTFACAVPAMRHSAAKIAAVIRPDERLEDNSNSKIDLVAQLPAPGHAIAVVELQHHVGDRLGRESHRVDLELLRL